MFHATSATLTRLAARIRDVRLARDQHTAAIYGWQVHALSATVHRYRDPRFDQLSSRSLARAGDRHG